MIQASDVDFSDFAPTLDWETFIQAHDINALWDECSKRIRVEVWNGEPVNGINLAAHPERFIRTKVSAAQSAGAYILKGYIDDRLAFIQYDHPETDELMTDEQQAVKDMHDFLTRIIITPYIENKLRAGV